MDSIEKNCEIVATTEGFVNYSIERRKITEKGNGFLGEITMVTIKDNDSDRTLDLVVKKVLSNEMVRKTQPVKEIYEVEAYFYSDVQPALDAIQKNIPFDQQFDSVAKCYRSCLILGHEMLVMENLLKRGYEMHDKKVLLNGDQIGKIFETYGKFHALSFALKETNPDEYGRITKNLPNMMKQFFESSGAFSNILNKSFKYLDGRILEENTKLKSVLKKYSKEAATTFEQLMHEEPQLCIVHGDCWSNNMLFKYEDNGENRKLQKVCLIDWQICHPGTPVFDLSYVFYSGASPDVIDNLNRYLGIYHASLSSMLAKLDCDVDKLYPYRLLEDHWKKYAKYGAMLGMIVFKMKYTYNENIKDFNDLTTTNDKEMEEIFSTPECDDSKFIPIVTYILNHLIDLGCIE